MYALVVYTSTETKLALNEGKYKTKISLYMKYLNIFLITNIIIMFLATLLCSQVFNRLFLQKKGDQLTYVFQEFEKPVNYEEYTMASMMSFYLLLNGLLPLDLAVNLIVTKLLMVYFVQNDHQMIDLERSLEEGDVVGCEVKNLTVLEDLPRVTHLFCDKTGTLTKNELVFRALAVGPNKFQISKSH